MSGPSPDICILEAHHREESMIYEQRIYTCIPGRLPALLKRFEEQTLKIWDKHGIKQAGFWTVLVGDGSQDLHYMLVWESLADREKKWNTFQADPAWHKARDESEASGPIIANIKSSFMRPTTFSSVK
jgi:NIPSNAP